MSQTVRPGQRVMIVTPTNARLHGTEATVRTVTEYGALLDAPAAATGEFRALADEVKVIAEPAPAPKALKPRAKDAGYTGDICSNCGGSRMRRNGACLLCDDCGTTSGCS